jgi:hypothetical protein
MEKLMRYSKRSTRREVYIYLYFEKKERAQINKNTM